MKKFLGTVTLAVMIESPLQLEELQSKLHEMVVCGGKLELVSPDGNVHKGDVAEVLLSEWEEIEDEEEEIEKSLTCANRSMTQNPIKQ